MISVMKPRLFKDCFAKHEAESCEWINLKCWGQNTFSFEQDSKAFDLPRKILIKNKKSKSNCTAMTRWELLEYSTSYRNSIDTLSLAFPVINFFFFHQVTILITIIFVFNFRAPRNRSWFTLASFWTTPSFWKTFFASTKVKKLTRFI